MSFRILLALLAAGVAALPCGLCAEPLFVAVGENGRRISSHDGLHWEHDQRWPETGGRLEAVAFGAGRFVAVGGVGEGRGGAKPGCIWSTADGEHWREVARHPFALEAIAWGQGRFVAAHGQRLLSSGDGDRFAAGRDDPAAPFAGCRALACGDTEAGFRFVAIGQMDSDVAGEFSGWRAVTSDGEKWDAMAQHIAPARSIAYGGGIFVIAGPHGLIESSHDGQSWTARATAMEEDFTQVLWTGEKFMAFGKRIWSSPDGFAWAPGKSAWPPGLAWMRAGFGALVFPLSGGVRFSRGEAAWQQAAFPEGPRIFAVAFRE